MASALEAKLLPDDILPTELEIYQHYLHLCEIKKESGEWQLSGRAATSLKTKAQVVMSDVAEQWKKTPIPHDFQEKKVLLRVEYLIEKIRNFTKNPRTDEEIRAKFDNFFDVALCKCSNICSCAPEKQVPSAWKKFLMDQRGDRKMGGFLSSRKLSLRGATGKEKEDRKRRAEIEEKMKEKKEVIEKKQKKEKESKMEMEEQFKKVKLEDREDSSGKRDSDSEWEELDDREGKKEKKKRNKKPLLNFARACDRFGISDRAGAFVGSSLLMDYGIITKEDTSHLIDPSKLRRQRLRQGKIIA